MMKFIIILLVAFGVVMLFLMSNHNNHQKTEFLSTSAAEEQALPLADVVLSIDGQLTTLRLDRGDSLHIITDRDFKIIKIEDNINGSEAPIVIMPHK